MNESEDRFKKLAELGDRIRRIRKTAGLKQKEFAQAIDISNTYLSFIERGLKSPKFDIFYNLAFRFNISMDYLFFGIEPMKLSQRMDGGKDERTGVDEILTPRDVMWFMEHSPLFKDTVMGYAAKYHLENEEIIKKNIDKARKRKSHGGNQKHESEE